MGGYKTVGGWLQAEEAVAPGGWSEVGGRAAGSGLSVANLLREHSGPFSGEGAEQCIVCAGLRLEM